ncbi:Histone H1 [Mesorhizobium sp. ORS 3324]|nr:Histone H1 [Mesorhizobium sp. ORS 3324]
MPTGPKGQKRIATGEETDDTPGDGKSAAAKELGSKGGKKRAANMSLERRAEMRHYPNLNAVRSVHPKHRCRLSVYLSVS